MKLDGYHAVVQLDDQDLRDPPLRERRRHLEELMASLVPPCG
jgi:ATP-dependent DNA ligase